MCTSIVRSSPLSINVSLFYVWSFTGFLSDDVYYYPPTRLSPNRYLRISFYTNTVQINKIKKGTVRSSRFRDESRSPHTGLYVRSSMFVCPRYALRYTKRVRALQRCSSFERALEKLFKVFFCSFP